MNAPSPTPAAAPTATESPTPAVAPLEARVAEVNAFLDEATAQSAGEATESPSSLPPAEVKPPPSPADSAAAQRAAERRARLDAWKIEQRDRVDAKARQSQQDRLAHDLAAAQRRAELAEAQAQSRLERDLLKDPARLVRMMGEEGVTPDKVADAIREAMTNPELAAERAAREATRTTYDPKIAALEARLAEQQARIDAYEQRAQAAEAAHVERQQTQAFLGFVQQSSERAPLAARLLETDADEFMQMAEIAAANVPGQGPQALLDAVEDLLDGETRKVAQKYAALYGLTSQPSAPTQPARAAAQANTVSNSLAQGRTAIVEEEDFAKLPIEERAARLIRSM